MCHLFISSASFPLSQFNMFLTYRNMFLFLFIHLYRIQLCIINLIINTVHGLIWKLYRKVRGQQAWLKQNCIHFLLCQHLSSQSRLWLSLSNMWNKSVQTFLKEDKCSVFSQNLRGTLSEDEFCHSKKSIIFKKRLNISKFRFIFEVLRFRLLNSLVSIDMATLEKIINKIFFLQT